MKENTQEQSLLTSPSRGLRCTHKMMKRNIQRQIMKKKMKTKRSLFRMIVSTVITNQCRFRIYPKLRTRRPVSRPIFNTVVSIHISPESTRKSRMALSNGVNVSERNDKQYACRLTQDTRRKHARSLRCTSLACEVICRSQQPWRIKF